jgi:hypothetical protein
MIAQDHPLPDDVDLLKSMVRAMAQKAAVLEGENAALKARRSDAPNSNRASGSSGCCRS